MVNYINTNILYSCINNNTIIYNNNLRNNYYARVTLIGCLSRLRPKINVYFTCSRRLSLLIAHARIYK